jgi:DNA-binding CsgD family transcriptional regulator/tetratricopeptide (TPR) repeat protein
VLGRAQELRRISVALDGARSVFVVGSAGVGKTTLVRAALRGRPHAVGEAVAGLRWRPFLPLMRAVGLTLDGDVDSVASAVVVALRGRVLFVDDLQWADGPTLDVLGLMVRTVQVVVTCRPGGDAAPWVDRLERLEIGALPAGASRRLACRLHPELPKSDLDRLVALAGGNPLLLEHLARDGVTTPTLRAALAGRLAALGSAARDSIIEIAVHGRPIELAYVGIPVDDLPSQLVDIADGMVALRHPKLAETVFEWLDPAERTRVHVRLARRLPPAAAAEHFLAGGDLVAAARCATEGLIGITDLVVRAHLLSIAADAAGDGTLRIEAAAACTSVGDYESARRHASAVTSADPAVVAEAALQLSRAHWFAGDPIEARRAAEAGLDALDGRDDPVIATLHVELAHQRVRTEEAGRSTAPVARAALAVAERFGVDVPRARNVLATSLAHDGLQGWEEAYREVIPEAAACGDAEAECSASYMLASHLGFAGRFDEAIELLETMIDRATALGQVMWRDHMACALLSNRFMTGGDPGRVADEARRFIVDHPLFRNRAQAELALALSLGDLGCFEEAFGALEAAMNVLTSAEDRSILLAALTELVWASGDPDRAIELAGEAMSLGPGWFGITAAAAAAAAYARFELGEPPTARPEPAKVAIFATFGMEVEALQAWSEGDAARAIEVLDAAAERWRLAGPRRYQARAQWAAGAIASRIADRSARRRLETAYQSASRAGLSPIARRAASGLRDIVRPYPLTPREVLVLELVQEGLTSPEIASRLGVARPTVETHVATAMRKLGARTRQHAAALLGQRSIA